MKPLTPLRAIRAKCLDCCTGDIQEVRLCPSKRCPLWGYRSGHCRKGTNIPLIELRNWKPLENGGIWDENEEEKHGQVD